MDKAPHSLDPADQLSLFDIETVSVDASLSTSRRIWLDPTSWIDFVPGWLSGSDVLFRSLRDSAAWEQRERWMYTKNVIEPRLTAEYFDVGDTPDVFLRTVARTLSAHYGVRYKRVWMNLYRDNQDGTGWHADHLAKQDHEAIIPVLSLGATRRFLIRPISGGYSTQHSARTSWRRPRGHGRALPTGLATQRPETEGANWSAYQPEFSSEP